MDTNPPQKYRNLKRAWWEPTDKKPFKVTVPRKLSKLDPLSHELPAPRKQTRNSPCMFAPSRKWLYYIKLDADDISYIAPVYRRTQIARRYGLSEVSSFTFCRKILPEPVGIFRGTGGGSPNLWPIFTLLALDVVLRDLESLGYQNMLPSFTQHVERVQRGADYITDYYTKKYEIEQPFTYDKYRVSWE